MPWHPVTVQAEYRNVRSIDKSSSASDQVLVIDRCWLLLLMQAPHILFNGHPLPLLTRTL